MKKAAIIGSIITVVLALGIIVTAWCNQDKDAEKFNIIINQNTDDKIIGIHCEYFLKNKAIGGFELFYANNMNFKKGEKITLKFEKAMFPNHDDINDFSAEIYLIDENNTETKTENDIKLNPEYGKNYEFDLSGGAKKYILNER